jgi:hypothetical protein
MSQLIRRARAQTILAVLGTTVLAGVAPSVASAACAPSPTSTPFAQFGDYASYSPVPEASFENGTAEWSLTDASVVPGNESFNVAGGSHSLAIGADGVAVSPSVCMSSEYPTFRFFARQLGGSSTSSLHVSLRFLDVLGLSVEDSVGSLSSDGEWAPSPILQLGDSVPIWLPGGSADVWLKFQAVGGGSWAIDDVYVDPYRT